MRISGWRSKHQVHGAAGGSVKCLAVLAGLLDDRALCESPVKLDESVSIHCFLPSARVPGVGRRNRFFTARVGAADGDKLPVQAPSGLAELCEHMLDSEVLDLIRVVNRWQEDRLDTGGYRFGTRTRWTILCWNLTIR
jgi:hypothetical protein